MTDIITKAFISNIEVGEKGRFKGIATAEFIDRQNEVVLVKGISYQLPIDLLLEHNSSQKIGQITRANIQKHKGQDALHIEGQIDLKNEKGDLSLQEREDLRLKAINGEYSFSIGFYSKESEKADNVNIIKKSNLIEISFVKVPANPEAELLVIKSLSELEYRVSEMSKELDKEYMEQRKKDEDFYMKKINETIERQELEHFISQYTGIRKKEVSFVIEKTSDFYKRCNDYKEQKEGVIQKNVEIKKENSIEDFYITLSGIKKS